MNLRFTSRCFAAGLLLFVSVGVAADASLKMLPYSGPQSKALKEQLDKFTPKYVEEHSLVSRDYPYKPAKNTKGYLPLYWHYTPDNTKYKEADTLYALGANGRDYIAAVISYNPLLTAEPHCQPDDSAIPTGHCERIARWQLTCHLFLFDAQSMNLESVTPLNIARDPRPLPGQTERSFWYYDEKHAGDHRQVEGWPRCHNVLSVAPAKEASDALLFTLGYIDSAAPADPRNEPPEYKTTVLVLLRQSFGNLKVIQEDSCLGNPNRYGSIAAARKALNACNKADKKVDPGEASWIDMTEVQPVRK